LSFRLDDLNSVGEPYIENYFRQLVVAIEATPVFLGGLSEAPHPDAPYGMHLVENWAYGLQLPYSSLKGPGFERLCFHLLLADGKRPSFSENLATLNSASTSSASTAIDARCTSARMSLATMQVI
jgi:hypothetical protein